MTLSATLGEKYYTKCSDCLEIYDLMFLKKA